MNQYSDPAIRITLLPRDTNSQGTIFGGVILSYIDMAGAIEAHRRTGMDRFVTVAMREVGVKASFALPGIKGGSAEALACEEIERGEAAFRTLISVHVGLTPARCSSTALRSRSSATSSRRRRGRSSVASV